MIGARLVWAISNFTVFICMMATTILSWISSDLYSSKLHHVIGANKTVKNSALVVFSLLGLPLSVSARTQTLHIFPPQTVLEAVLHFVLKHYRSLIVFHFL